MVVVAGGAALAAAPGARANPPPSQTLPDPRVTAPAESEAPSIVRRHRAGCFASFPSGGTLLVACPEDLLGEGIGASIQRQPSGRCQHVPFRTGTPAAKTGYGPCPAIFAVVRPAGVIDSENQRYAEQYARTHAAPAAAWSPPIPARLAPSEVQQPDACALGRSSSGPPGPMVLFGAAWLFRRRRR